MNITALVLTAIISLINLTAYNHEAEVDTQITIDETQQQEENEMGDEKMENVIERAALANTYLKLTQDKEITIAYIGGSVTDGYGSTNHTTKSWAAHLGNWIEENYPDVALTNKKLSIGGTGSYLASYRYAREVAPINPDLLFIEYAVNDKGNGATYDQVVKSSESIVRLANNYNPSIDIIYVLTFNTGTKDSDYDQLRAHRDVADYYGYPHIKMADHVYAMLADTGDEFSKYFKDSVHPNDEGYKFYSEVIIELVESELAKAKEQAVTECADKMLPENTLASYVTMNANMIYADEIDLSDSEGWEYQPKTNYSWLGKRYNGRIFANKLGARLTFEFEGTELGLATGIGPNMGIITVTVDDNAPVVIDEYRTSTNPKDRVIAENLLPCKHTVTIEVTGKNANSGGYEFEIGAILVG
ncbi:MAG: hypothetical protein IKU43_07385 [Clostridia bacterium]|nr:hypothetical protein [Clostridia bacterium]